MSDPFSRSTRPAAETVIPESSTPSAQYASIALSTPLRPPAQPFLQTVLREPSQTPILAHPQIAQQTQAVNTYSQPNYRHGQSALSQQRQQIHTQIQEINDQINLFSSQISIFRDEILDWRAKSWATIEHHQTALAVYQETVSGSLAEQEAWKHAQEWEGRVSEALAVQQDLNAQKLQLEFWVDEMWKDVQRLKDIDEGLKARMQSEKL